MSEGRSGSGLSAEQLRNAAIIYRVGVQMGMTNRDIQIALITAMTESRLINVNYGDRDSLGLFQQRPSQGWGTPEQVTDPVYAARKFYSALKGLGQRRYQMGMGEAAQAVQRSAYPDRYAQQLGLIRSIYPTVQQRAGDHPQAIGGGPYNPGKPGPFTPMPGDPGSGYVAPTIADTWQAMYGDQLGYQPQAPNPASVLSAGYNTALSAPTFDAMGNTPAWASPLSQGTFQAVQDAAATQGTFPIGKGVDGWRAAVVSAARKAIGTPYEWGGNSLQNGVDCSGLVQQAFAQVGIQLPRVSYQQANYGQKVGLNALRPGDLVAWNNSTRNNGADHIAIYIGNGQIIEAPRPGIGVRIRTLGHNEGAWGVRMHR